MTDVVTLAHQLLYAIQQQPRARHGLAIRLRRRAGPFQAIIMRKVLYWADM